MRASELLVNDAGEPTEWRQAIPAKEWYTVQETSIILLMGTTQVYDCIKRGTMPAYEVNSVTHVKHNDLVDYIDRRQRGAPSVPSSGEAHIVRIVPSGGNAEVSAQAAQAVQALTKPGSKPAAAKPAKPAKHIPLESAEPTDGLNLDDLDLGEG